MCNLLDGKFCLRSMSNCSMLDNQSDASAHFIQAGQMHARPSYVMTAAAVGAPGAACYVVHDCVCHCMLKEREKPIRCLAYRLQKIWVAPLHVCLPPL